MSKWTEFRDQIEDALNLDDVTEDMKQKFGDWCLTLAFPLAEKVGEKFVAKTKADAANESGWNAIRDSVLFPALVSGGLWLIKYLLVKTGATETQETGNNV